MTEEPERDVALWPSRENYARFAELCDDQVPLSFEEFEEAAERQAAAMARQGIQVQRISFDPEKMAQWCRTNFGAVNAHARAAYAGFLALSN